jgi:hypothetical protein
MTFLELCQITRQECGIQGQGPVTVVGQSGILKKVIDWVAKADVFIQSKYGDWDFLWSEFRENTTTNSRDIAKPANLGLWDRESFAVDYGTDDGKPLSLVDYKTDRRDTGLRQSNPPSDLVILPDGNLRLCCPADGVYEIYANYWKNPVVMAANTDTPLYPARFHWAAVERAKMSFFADQEAFELYKEAKLRFDDWMEKLEGNQLPGQQSRTQAQPDLDLMTVRVE